MWLQMFLSDFRTQTLRDVVDGGVDAWKLKCHRDLRAGSLSAVE